MLKIKLTLGKDFFMSHSSKIFIGILSFMPIILVIVFFTLFLRLFPMIFEWEHYEPAPGEVFSVFAPIIILAVIMALISLGLLVFFIIHLVGNKTMDSTERVIWILVFLFAGIVGYPIYWYLRVWKNEQGSL